MLSVSDNHLLRQLSQATLLIICVYLLWQGEPGANGVPGTGGPRGPRVSLARTAIIFCVMD